MKLRHNVLVLIATLFAVQSTIAQDWVAVIDFEIHHPDYGYERIDEARVNFSGIEAIGSSETNRSRFILSGNNPMSGNIHLTISGVAWGAYNAPDPENIQISATYIGNYQVPCIRKGFTEHRQFTRETLIVWIEIFPRMNISSFLQECDKITLMTNTCSSSFVWEISDNIFSGFRTIPGKSTPTITITREEIQALGFSSPYGRRYFRVTGVHNPTSQLQPVDIYYPGPSLILSKRDPSCVGQADGSIFVSITSPLPSHINDFVVTLLSATSGDPLDQAYLSDDNKLEFSHLRHGHYTIRVENNSSISLYGNCSTEQTFAVIDPPPLTISSTEISNFNGFQVSCQGAKDGSIEISPAGGTGNFVSFEWSPNVSSFPAATNLGAGSYVVRIKDSNGCWSDHHTYLVREPDKLTANLRSTGGRNGFDVSCHQSEDGEILAEVAGGVQPYRYSWNDGNTSPTRKNLSAGSYSMIVTDLNGCEAASSAYLLAPDPITFAIEEINGISCPGDRTGSLAVQGIANAIGGVSYQWSTGETQSEVSDKPAGVYTLTISDAQGCSATMSYELEEPPGLRAEAVAISDYHGETISCHGFHDGSAMVYVYDMENNPVVADHYTWFRNGVELISGSSLATANDLSGGIYTVIVTYRNYCTVEATVTLDEPEPVDARISTVSNFNGSIISCAGASDGHIRADAFGGTGSLYSFEWNTGARGAELRNIGEGVYSVTVRDLNGCMATRPKEVTAPNVLGTKLEQLSPVTCFGSSDARLQALVKGGIGPYEFEWTSGQRTQQLENIGAGVYGVTTTDANGCTSNANITITGPPPLATTFLDRSDFNGYGVSCNGSTDGYLLAQALGGSGSYVYHWDGSQSHAPGRSGLSAGSYRVIITDQNGCRDSAETSVSEPPPLTLKVESFKNVSCNKGGDGELSLVAAGGTGTFEYSVAQSWQSSPVIASLPAGSHQILVRDANGCTSTRTQVLTEPPPLTIRFSDTEPSLCGDPMGKVTSIVSGGTTPYTLDWTDDKNNSLGDSYIITGLPPGIFALTVRDNNGCIARESVGITSTDGPIVELLDLTNASCSYSADGIAALDARGYAPFSFRWPDGNTQPKGQGLRKGTYLVEVVDANDCKTIAPVTISAPDSLTVEVIDYTMPTCYGDCNGKVRVQAHGGKGTYAYDWSNAEGPSLNNICSGTYTVTVLDQNQCTATADIEVGQPQAVATQTTAIRAPTCAQDCDAFIEVEASGGTGNLLYDWSNGTHNSTATNLCPGEYSVIVRDENGCTANATYVIEKAASPQLELGPPVLLCRGQTHLLDAGAGWARYEWISSRGHQASERWLMISDPGTYWLSVEDQKGCVARDTFQMETSDDLLKANFMLPSEAYITDTVVAIDISWPLPETIRWIVPTEMDRISDSGDVIFGRFEDPGVYELTLEATLGECRDRLTKSVSIMVTQADAGTNGRLGHQPFIEKFAIYPNPNNGSFDFAVSFIEESPMVLSIFDVTSSRLIAEFREDGNHHYKRRIDLGALNAGTYTIRLDHRKGSTYKRMVVR